MALAPGAPLIRELLAGLLAAALLISGLASARLAAAKADPAFARHAFALCLAGDEGGRSPDHDCDTCRLGNPPALPQAEAVAVGVPTLGGRKMQARPERRSAPARLLLPWSRGPPDFA